MGPVAVPNRWLVLATTRPGALPAACLPICRHATAAERSVNRLSQTCMQWLGSGNSALGRCHPPAQRLPPPSKLSDARTVPHTPLPRLISRRPELPSPPARRSSTAAGGGEGRPRLEQQHASKACGEPNRMQVLHSRGGAPHCTLMSWEWPHLYAERSGLRSRLPCRQGGVQRRRTGQQPPAAGKKRAAARVLSLARTHAGRLQSSTASSQPSQIMSSAQMGPVPCRGSRVSA